MGITFLKVKIINLSNLKKSKELNFLVDSGAIYSVVDSRVLKKLDIKPSFFKEFMLANGEIIKKPVGNCYFEYKGVRVASPVIFGEKDIFLLGATTLEALGLILDPINRELKPLPMVLMKFAK